MLRYDDHDAKRKRTSGKISAAAIANRISRIVSARDCKRGLLERVISAHIVIRAQALLARRKETQCARRSDWEPVVQIGETDARRGRAHHSESPKASS